MPGLVPGIHVLHSKYQGADARHKASSRGRTSDGYAGHDE